MYSPSIDNLIASLKKLPTVGQHTAERYVFYWLKTGKKSVTELILALNNLIKNVKSCSICWNFSDSNPCTICASPKRDHSQICVVADVTDLVALENTKEYNGVYHILRGLLDLTDEKTLSGTKIKSLLERIETAKKPFKEIILALNPSVAGETTMLYLQKEINKISAGWRTKIKITRLARGLPMGGDLLYADEITLGSALKNRTIK